MTDTQSKGYKRPANKFFILVITVLFIAGLGLVAYAMYSSNRNDGDQAEDRKTQAVKPTEQQPAASDVNQQNEAKKQPASEVGQQTTVKLYANSGSQLVNTVQTQLNYPADSLTFVSIANSTAFPKEFATDTKTPGVIKLVRTVDSQAASVKGEQPVATVTFTKLKDVNASKAVTVTKSESFLVTSTGNNDLIKSGQGSLTIR